MESPVTSLVARSRRTLAATAGAGLPSAAAAECWRVRVRLELDAADCCVAWAGELSGTKLASPPFTRTLPTGSDCGRCLLGAPSMIGRASAAGEVRVGVVVGVGAAGADAPG